MLNKVSVIIEILALAGLIWGYSKKSRNVMLAAALLLWLGGSLNDFVSGFIAGMKAAG